MSGRTLILGGGPGGTAAGVELRRLLGPVPEVVVVTSRSRWGCASSGTSSAVLGSPTAVATAGCSSGMESSSSKRGPPRSTLGGGPPRRAEVRSRRTAEVQHALELPARCRQSRQQSGDSFGDKYGAPQDRSGRFEEPIEQE
jgi:hypothetical protein